MLNQPGESRSTKSRLQLLTVLDVAQVLRVSRRQVWRLKAAGILPQPVKVGHSVRWDQADIDQFIERQKVA